MKVLAILFFSLLALSIKAQTYFEAPQSRTISLEAIPTANRTVHGWKYGVRVGLNLSNKWNFGYTRIQSAGTSETGQKVYSGAYFQRAINPKSKIVIVPTLRVGLYDNQFLAVQPSLEANFKATKNTQFLVGIGKVDGYPSFDLGLKLNLTRIK